jgi:hypothetical protein
MEARQALLFLAAIFGIFSHLLSETEKKARDINR